jgi:uncharacterized phage protein gp47/JayE
MSLNSLTRRRIDFTSKDFESWLVELRLMAQSVYPSWTDHNRANIGNLQHELFAHTLDVMTHSIDQQTNERLVICARQRKSMIDLGKFVGYELPGATEASVDLEFTLSDGTPRSHDVIIPAGTRVRAPDAVNPVTFWVVAGARILAGTIQISNVAARNAEPQIDSFTGDGSLHQKVKLARTPYLDQSAQVVVGGDVYTEVDNLLLYDATDKVFMVEVDEADQASLMFGDNVNGLAPTGIGSCAYDTGGGVIGNVEANTISEVLDSLQDELGASVICVVRNPSLAGGGTDRMTVEEARVAIPESVLTANLVTCSRDQFEINARRVRGVARSLVLVHDDDATIPEYQSDVYIVPTGGGLPSAALKAEVLNEITVVRPQPVGMDVFVLDPALKIISITATVFLKQGYTQAEVRANIEAALDAFFALTDAEGNPNPLVDFGFHVKDYRGMSVAEVPWSDIFNAVRDAEGVRKVSQTFIPAADVTLLNNEFPVLGSIFLNDGDLGTPF